jgi:hypothetical protein
MVFLTRLVRGDLLLLPRVHPRLKWLGRPAKPQPIMLNWHFPVKYYKQRSNSVLIQ